MPKEITRHQEIIDAISAIGALKALTRQQEGRYEYELDLEVVVYGRNYHGKRVGPYVRLLDYDSGEEIVRAGDWGGNEFYFIVSGMAEVWGAPGAGPGADPRRLMQLGVGQQFGEMSVLAGSRRAASVRAPQSGGVRVLEVSRPALRLLRKLPGFSEVLDSNYRTYGRAAMLDDLGTKFGLGTDLLARLEAISRFRIFARGHVLFSAGDPIRKLYLLRSGWVRLSDRKDGGEELPQIFGPGSCLGLEGVTQDRRWERQGTLSGRTELLEIPIDKLRQSTELREALRRLLGGEAPSVVVAPSAVVAPVLRAQESLIETGLADGTNLLVMDMDLCVRCGNCSLACHRMHGQSRLLRRGISIERPRGLTQMAKQSLLAPSVCLHCKDPECLTGCPTGAIGRQADGQVDIDPKSCIGCADCATQCPYNAISMVSRKGDGGAAGSGSWFDLFPATMPEPVVQTDDLLAVKCNLCSGTPLNPPGVAKRAYSCEENCPTGALMRVEPRVYFDELRSLEGPVIRDGNQVIARGFPRQDSLRQWSHAAGIILTVAVTAIIGVGLWRGGLDTPLSGGWLDWRWITGLVGLAGIAGVMAYPVRRRIYRQRRGPLRYWLLMHSYLGVIGGIALLLHGGTRSGGLLTTALMVSFDLVVLTGLLGILLYVVVPRLLTRVEEQPLLLEDLLARREELSDEMATRVAAEPPLRSLLEQRLMGRGRGPIGWAGVIARRESLADSIAREVSAHTAALPTIESGLREGFLRLIDLVVTLRRIDLLVLLHRSLRFWLAPHVIFTSLMLALMLVHIVQVIYFETR